MYYVGIDIGSTASKAVVLDEDKHTVLHKRVVPSGWNSKETGEQLLQWIYSQGFIRDQLKIIATVYEPNTKRILLTGTPLSIPNWKLHQIIETNGGAVVCEEMCTGIRYCEALVDENKRHHRRHGAIDVNLKFYNLYDTEGFFVERAMKEAGIP